MPYTIVQNQGVSCWKFSLRHTGADFGARDTPKRPAFCVFLAHGLTCMDVRRTEIVQMLCDLGDGRPRSLSTSERANELAPAGAARVGAIYPVPRLPFFVLAYVYMYVFIFVPLVKVSPQTQGHKVGCLPPTDSCSCLAVLLRVRFSPPSPPRLTSNCAYTRQAHSARCLFDVHRNP